jgi:hypothetical protein
VKNKLLHQKNRQRVHEIHQAAAKRHAARKRAQVVL